MTMGCCGRSTTALGLLAEADAFPPSHPRGARARRQIAYSVAAYKAKQAGNRHAYDRAMAGLRGLGTGEPTTGYHSTPAPTAADAAAAQARLQEIARQTQARVATDLATAGTYINLVLAAGQIGTGIAGAACNGCDRTGIDAVNLVISIVRSVITPGSSLTVPTLSVDTLNGLVAFCIFKDTIKGIIQGVFAAISGAATAANNSSAASALMTISGFVGNLLDAICNIPQVQIAIAAASTPPATTEPPAQPAVPQTIQGRCWSGQAYTQTWDPATARWGAPSPACPPPPPAAGLEAGAGGCGSGSFNRTPPAGVLNPVTGTAIPGTAGTRNCARCSAPSTYVPGIPDARGFWASPPGCMASNGRVINSPASGPCPAGTSRGSDGVCARGGTSGGLLKVALPAAAVLWYFMR